MEKKKYQVRIRKDVTLDLSIQDSLALLGCATATEIKTLEGEFESMVDAFEQIANIPELSEYEVISVILIDTDNSDQLGEDFEWESEE